MFVTLDKITCNSHAQLVAISKGMQGLQAVKLYTNKILQLLTQVDPYNGHETAVVVLAVVMHNLQPA